MLSQQMIADGPGNGWKTSGQNKRGIRGRGQKRKAVLMNLDLKKFRPRSIGETPESLANWLADSRPAWNQLIATLRIKRQSKKQKQAKWLLDDGNWVILCFSNSYNTCWPKMPPEGRRFFSAFFISKLDIYVSNFSAICERASFLPQIWGRENILQFRMP